MSNHDQDLAISELANAVQALVGLSLELRRALGAAKDTAAEMDAAVGRAVRALKQLQPKEDH